MLRFRNTVFSYVHIFINLEAEFPWWLFKLACCPWELQWFHA